MAWTAFLLGLTGSLHCAGMCSPLVMAVTKISGKVWVNRLTYNAGRIFTYAIFGMMAGLMGEMLNLNAIQKPISLLTGLLLIGMGLWGIKSLRIPWLTPLGLKISIQVKSLFGKMLSQRNASTIFILGMLNGFLPCGMTYFALILSLSTATALGGALFMVQFGLGTLPAMLGLPYLLFLLTGKLRLNFKWITTTSFILLGILLIGRIFVSDHALLHINHKQNQEEPICR